MKKMRGGDYMEPNKELKFGGAKGPKPKRRKAGDGDPVEKDKSFIDKIRDGADYVRESINTAISPAREAAQSAQEKAANAADKVRNTVSSSNNSSSNGKSKAKAKTTSNPYSAAKKKDANLDSYIKARNSATKGSNEYNDAQNKINRAYGKGPTDRKTTDGPEKKGENITQLNKRGPAKNSNAREFTLQTNMTSTKTPATKSPTKKESRQTGRAAMKDRRQSARSRKAAAKEANAGESRKVQRAAGKMAKANVKGNTAKSDRAVDRFTKAKGRESERAANQQSRADRKNRLADIKANKKSELKAARGKAKMGGPARKKAMTGLAVQAAGAGLQGVGKLTDAIAGKETKFGKIADAAGSTAVTAGGMMGGVPGAQTALDGVKGAVPPPGGQMTGPVANPAAPATTTSQPSAAPTNPEADRAMRRGGKKKGKKGMMKYKAGGAKPDYLDMDKDGNKTEPMTKALKDRRSKAKMGKKR